MTLDDFLPNLLLLLPSKSWDHRLRAPGLDYGALGIELGASGTLGKDAVSRAASQPESVSFVCLFVHCLFLINTSKP